MSSVNYALRTIFFLLVCLATLNPTIKVFSLNFSASYIAYHLLFAISLFAYAFLSVRFDTRLRNLATITLVCITFSLISGIRIALDDPTFLFLSSAGFVIVFLIPAYIWIMRKLCNHDPLGKFYEIFLFANFVNSVVLIWMFINPDFADLVYNYFAVSDRQFEYSYVYRPSGLVYLGFGYLAILNAVSILGGLYLIVQKRNLISNIVMATQIMVVFVAMNISGRIGLVFIILCLLITSIIDRRARFVSLGILVFVAATIAALINAHEYFDENIRKTVYWGLELFINAFDGAGLESTTLNELIENHYAIKFDNLLTMLFGTGYYNVGIVGSDVGFVQLLHGGGIAVLLSTILFFMYLFFLNCMNYRKRASSYSFIVPIPLALLLLNLKDLYFITFTGVTLFVFLSATLYEVRENK